MRRPSRLRLVGRALLAILAAGFGCAAYIYLTLPDVRPLHRENPGTTAFMDLRAGEALMRGEEPRRIHIWARYSRISPHLKRAVLVAEDPTFWRHDGIDLQQIKRSMDIKM